MGTHPIFESDFDCLTEMNIARRFGSLAVASGAVGGFMVALDAACADERKKLRASGGEVHPPAWPFDFNESNKMYDAAALRRGWHVYKNVCKTCHSMEYLYFREMIGHSHTEEEVRSSPPSSRRSTRTRTRRATTSCAHVSPVTRCQNRTKTKTRHVQQTAVPYRQICH